MKRRLSLLLAVVMILGSFSFAFAAEKTAEEEAGAFLMKVGVLEGINGELKLEDNLRRQDAVVLIARLHGAEEEAEKFPTDDLTFTDFKDPYYRPIIAWAVANNLVEGHTPERFGFNEDVTAQQYATILLRALGYNEEVAGKDGYDKALELAKELGLLENVEVEKDTAITRGQMAVLTFNALGTNMKDSDKTLADKLGIEMPEPDVLEVEEVFADNLKEIQVKFNKEVDVDSAVNVDNYETNAGDIVDVTYADNVAVLLMKDAMKNKKSYTLTINGVKDDKTTLSVSKNFTVVDNAIPEVVDVVGLGTKAFKIVMSEPVVEKVAKSTKNYTLNGSAYYGGVEVVGREIVLRPYGGLKVGENEVTVKGLEDFAGLKSIETKHVFEVIEDKDAPEVVDVYGTLERVVVEFNEDIDMNSVKATNIYWKDGSTKKYPSTVTRIAGNKFAFEFDSKNALPIYEVTLYIEKFADYSGNVMATVEKPYKGTIDESRPEVIKAELDEDLKTIIVKFNKAVDGGEKDKKNLYTLVDDVTGKTVAIKNVNYESVTNKKVVKVELYNKLSADRTYTLKIAGVRDLTKLQNTMLPSEHKIVVDDYAKPEFLSVTGNKDKRTLYVVFNKDMDLATIANPDNYLIRGTDANKTRSLGSISGVDTEVVQNGKAVIIELPKKIGNDSVELGSNVKELAVLAVKDTAGNTLKNYGEFKEISLEKPEVKSAIAKDKETVVVEFSQPIVEVTSYSAFDLVSSDLGSPRIVDIKGIGTTKLTLVVDELKADAYKYTLKIDADYLKTASGDELTSVSEKLKDEIKPTLEKAKAELNEEETKVIITAIFDEEVKTTDVNNLKLDFEVIREVDGYKFKTTELASVTIDEGNVKIEIDIDTAEKDSRYKVSVVNPKFVTDVKGNVANASKEPIEAPELVAVEEILEKVKNAETVAKTKIAAVPALTDDSDLATVANAIIAVEEADDAIAAALVAGISNETIKEYDNYSVYTTTKEIIDAINNIKGMPDYLNPIANPDRNAYYVEIKLNPELNLSASNVKAIYSVTDKKALTPDTDSQLWFKVADIGDGGTVTKLTDRDGEYIILVKENDGNLHKITYKYFNESLVDLPSMYPTGD